jgi:anti-anti-sigma factor
MTKQTRISTDGETRTIHVGERFDFSVHQVFRDLYRDAPVDINRYIVDLSSTEYMDSSALGMLLLLREQTDGRDAAVQIRNCSAQIRKILEIANFDRIFGIS